MAEISEFRDVVYGRVGTRDLKCDVYLPKQADKSTAIIGLHGGAFRGGSKESKSAKMRLFAERGYTVVSADYRLSPEGARWPDPLEDTKVCIRWVRASAMDLQIDPQKIVLVGDSAGAMLSLIASGSQDTHGVESSYKSPSVSSAIAACIAYYPLATMPREIRGMPIEIMPEGSTEADYASASPINFVHSSCGPTLLFHGTADSLAQYSSSEELFRKLTSATVPAELHLFDGADHEFDAGNPELAEVSVSIAELFIDRFVTNPRRFTTFAENMERNRR